MKKRSVKSGIPAGSLIHIGEKKVSRVKISLINYDAEQYREESVRDVAQCFEYKDSKALTWISIDGIHETEIFKKIGDCFGVHPLILEDILNTEQRPKVEDFSDYVYIVLKLADFDENNIKKIIFEQVSIIFGRHYLISIQEKPLNIYEPVRQRLKNNIGNIRKYGTDYLAYTLIDTIIDNYFYVLEKTGERFETIENKLIISPSQKLLKSIYNLKRDVLYLRKSVWPLREVISRLERD
ncbi:MAG: magnesium and cobalt transport protein CorA, partial [Actinobacteria bacterium]|nr:magnesium and cobalt transport protein CorA [Actinomycetota bacterium]